MWPINNFRPTHFQENLLTVLKPMEITIPLCTWKTDTTKMDQGEKNPDAHAQHLGRNIPRHLGESWVQVLLRHSADEALTSSRVKPLLQENVTCSPSRYLENIGDTFPLAGLPGVGHRALERKINQDKFIHNLKKYWKPLHQSLNYLIEDNKGIHVTSLNKHIHWCWCCLKCNEQLHA